MFLAANLKTWLPLWATEVGHNQSLRPQSIIVLSYIRMTYICGERETVIFFVGRKFTITKYLLFSR